MTLNAQLDIAIGALCSATQFRNVIFECKDLNAVQEELGKYGASNDVTFSDIATVANKVWEMVTDPERQAFFNGCIVPFCKIWPCR